MENKINKEDEQNKEEKLVAQQSKSEGFEKYFWGTLIVLIMGYVILTLSAKINTDDIKQITNKEPLIIKYIEVPSDKIKENLTANQQQILENFQQQVEKINNSIDKEVDTIFHETINKNIDTYLDFHYSVFGSYSELFTMASDSNYEQFIREKLLGTDFNKQIEKATENITNVYKNSLNEHQDFITKTATEGVDLQLNSKALERIKSDINNNLLGQEVKLGVIGGAISVKITSLILARVGTKVAVKTSAKVATKMAGAGGGATAGGFAGLACGPGAAICSPVGAVIGAVGVWIATDVAINTADEKLYREELKKEILNVINEEKQKIKNEYISVLNPKIQDISNQMQYQFRNANIKEKKQIKDNFK